MKEFLNNLVPKEQAKKLIALGKQRTLAEGDYLVRAGEIPRKFAFVSSGLFRYVYINEKGMEFTKNIIEENGFIVSYSSMINEKASHFYIEALEDSKIIELKYSDWLKIKDSHPCWNTFLVQLLEHAFIIKEARERDFLLLDAPTRFQNFLQENPKLVRRAKQNIIASYLGIQPESLSRIKKKLSS
ncbi:Crp/Fnr family transcriptional regulator [uncultured Maribacter sp.]|uniref:Crp/Fnr family transcriptional regulator n=1 Tax=uncultured Maribacter sp. TaxID=431308 RepID=UPI0026291538|nr:Crp/Fnr family transcriptional regulator [uncultured Maribacter sp.]